MPASELELLVARLRQGDTSVSATITGNHMRLAMSIVAKYAHRYPYLTDDMVGAAMMGICQAVEWAPTRLYDNNITPYIYQTCERFIRDLIEKRNVVNMPREMYQKLREEDAFVPLVQMINAIKDDEDNYFDEYDLITEQSARIIDENPILFEELIESLALSSRDKMIVNLLVEEYSQTEIAKLIGVSDEMIRLIRKQIGEKLTRYRSTK
jgi:RNA polymerase sigma factor (sigma-70 family)